MFMFLFLFLVPWWTDKSSRLGVWMGYSGVCVLYLGKFVCSRRLSSLLRLVTTSDIVRTSTLDALHFLASSDWSQRGRCPRAATDYQLL